MEPQILQCTMILCSLPIREGNGHSEGMLRKKDDVSIRRIRDLLMRPYFTVREWLWRVHKRGPDNISDKKIPGASGVPGPEKMRSSGRYCANCLPGTDSSRGHDSYT